MLPTETRISLKVGPLLIFEALSFPFADRPGSTSPGLLACQSIGFCHSQYHWFCQTITSAYYITQDSQATMAPPPPAAATDTSAAVGTTYARADTTVDANSSEVLSDVPSIPLIVDLSAPATDDSIPSSTLVPPASLSLGKKNAPALNYSSTSGSIHPMVPRSRDGTRRPRTFSSMESTPHLLPSPYAALLASSSPREPTSFKEASKDSGWVSAMKDEYTALLQNNTWSLVPYEPSMNVVGCRWV